MILKRPRDKLGLAIESNANVSDFPFFHFFSKRGVRGRSEIMFAHGGGQLGAIMCKVFRLEVYMKMGVRVKNLKNMQA